MTKRPKLEDEPLEIEMSVEDALRKLASAGPLAKANTSKVKR